jgi:hypothetical protein
VFPFSVDFKNVTEAHKYVFDSLKLLEKQSLSDTPLLDDQISVMWAEMKARRHARSKTPINSAYQRVIFVFEFMNGGRSSLQPLGSSNNHLRIPSFNSIRALGGIVQQNSIDKMLFNLNDIVPLKLIELPEGLMSQEGTIQHVLFFVDRRAERVYSIGLQTISQFNDSGLLETLKENRVVVQSTSGFHTSLRNLFLFSSSTGDFKLDSNLFSSIETAAAVSLNNESSDYFDPPVALDEDVFVDSVFPVLEDDSAVKPYDFVNLSGRVINVCEDGFNYGFTCSLCNSWQSNAFESCVECERCRCETVSMDAQVQVVLNCVGVCRQVKLRLHHRTLQRLVRSSRERFESVFDYISVELMCRELSSVLGFVESVYDTEIYVQELVLN